MYVLSCSCRRYRSSGLQLPPPPELDSERNAAVCATSATSRPKRALRATKSVSQLSSTRAARTPPGDEPIPRERTDAPTRPSPAVRCATLAAFLAPETVRSFWSHLSAADTSLFDSA